jgi:hypothetical protein
VPARAFRVSVVTDIGMTTTATFSYEHQAIAIAHSDSPVIREVPETPAGKLDFDPFDPYLVDVLARTSDSCGEILVKLGVTRESWYFRKLAYTAALYNIALPVHVGRPDGEPAWRDKDRLAGALTSNTMMRDVCHDLGVSPCGVTHKRIRDAAVAFGIELPAWALSRRERRRSTEQF